MAVDTPDDKLEHVGGPWRAVLKAELVETGAAVDADLISVARELLALLHPDGLPTGPRYAVDASHAQGVQVGDNNTQTNTFGVG